MSVAMEGSRAARRRQLADLYQVSRLVEARAHIVPNHSNTSVAMYVCFRPYTTKLARTWQSYAGICVEFVFNIVGVFPPGRDDEVSHLTRLRGNPI